VPTILRFRGFNIIIFVDDHDPPHIHVRGKGVELSYWLNCPDGPVSYRDGEGRISPNEQRALEVFLNDNVGMLCERWSEIDDQRS
jgi:hypothetical protein